MQSQSLTPQPSQPQPISAEMLREAMQHGHEPCTGGCIHEDAINACLKDITEDIAKCLAYALSAGISPALMIYSAALHVGYHLRTLETTPTPKDKVN